MTTYLLIHGGGVTARFWDRLVPLLEGDGLAVDLPGRAEKPADLATLTVDGEVRSVLDDVDAAGINGPMVVVAHSSGGLVVPGVLAGLGDRVTHVVLNAASVPPEGGSGLDCMQPRHRDGMVRALEQARQEGRSLTTQGPPSDPEAFRRTYGGEPLDDETLAFVTDPVRLVPDTMHHYFQPVFWSVAGDAPVSYLLNERDRPIPPALQEEMVGRLPRPPTLIRLDGGHIPPVTAPGPFAEILRSVSAG